MKITVLTLFPEMINQSLGHSIISKALAKDLLEVEVLDLRDFTTDKHHTADDSPFGGGAGMVMKPEPIFRAFDYLNVQNKNFRSIFMTPQGIVLDHQHVVRLVEEDHIVILCGHYEGIDERVREQLIDEEISIGDYVLTGGELPALVLIDAVARFIPGVLGNNASLDSESFTNELLDYPQYTRPRVFRGLEVPPVLLSGNHQQIAAWRSEQALKRTKAVRPDLLESKNIKYLRKGE